MVAGMLRGVAGMLQGEKPRNQLKIGGFGNRNKQYISAL
jgi:hypothetical protein